MLPAMIHYVNKTKFKTDNSGILLKKNYIDPQSLIIITFNMEIILLVRKTVNEKLNGIF